jgi:hypothetical protein
MIRLRHQPRHEEHSNGPAGDPDRVTGSAAHHRPRRAAARPAEATTSRPSSLPLIALDRSSVTQSNTGPRIVRVTSSSRVDRSPRSGADLPPAPLRRFRRSIGSRAKSTTLRLRHSAYRIAGGCPCCVPGSGSTFGPIEEQPKNNRIPTRQTRRPDVSAYTVRSFGVRDGLRVPRHLDETIRPQNRQRSYGERAASRCICNSLRRTVWT